MTFKIEDSLLGSLTVPDTEEMLKTLLAPVQAELDQIDAAIDAVETQLKRLRETRRRLMAIKNAASPPNAVKAKVAKKSHKRGIGVSEEKIDQVLDFFMLHQNEEIQHSAVEAATRLNSNAVHLALRALVEREMIYFAGMGGQTGRAKLYKLLPHNEEN